MSEPKWTKGPWRFSDASGEVFAEAGQVIIDIDTSGNIDSDDERDANARLIAAAPQMYDALERLLADLPSRRDWLDPDIERLAKDALRAARGESE